MYYYNNGHLPYIYGNINEKYMGLNLYIQYILVIFVYSKLKCAFISILDYH